MITLKRIKNVNKKNIISFECNKNVNYVFVIIIRLIKIIYNEINKINSFDLEYRDVIKINLFNVASMFNEKLIKQMLININQAFSTLIQKMRTLHITQTKRVFFKTSNMS